MQSDGDAKIVGEPPAGPFPRPPRRLPFPPAAFYLLSWNDSPPEPRFGTAMLDAEKPEIVLQSRSGWIPVDWGEILATRELFFTMVSRDIQVRYKQTILGVGWAIIQPLLTMVVFANVFSTMLGNVDTQGVPYAIYMYAGMVPWTFFANAVNASGVSALSQQYLLSKIYFPRVYAPTAPIGAALLDMVVAYGLFIFLFPYYHWTPSWQIVFVPVLMLITFAGTLGVGLIAASLVVLFRDFRYILTFGLQLVFYLTPVLLPSSYYKKYAVWLAINPMFGMVDGFRSAFFGLPWNIHLVGISTASAVAFFLLGIYFFRRIERHMADVL